MKKLIAFLFSSALVLSAPAGVFAADKNCSDFSTQEEAQQYFVSHGGSKYNNVDGLDRDHDGIACESLPHGSSSNSGSAKHSSTTTTQHSTSPHSTSGTHTSTSHHITSGSNNVQPQPSQSKSGSGNGNVANGGTTGNGGNNVANNTAHTTGGKLPKTATNYPTGLMIGAAILLAGAGMLAAKPAFVRR